MIVVGLAAVFVALFAALDSLAGPTVTRRLRDRGINADDLYVMHDITPDVPVVPIHRQAYQQAQAEQRDQAARRRLTLVSTHGGSRVH